MKILSINVAEPKKILFNGKELITSIYKIPVNKTVTVTELGLEGDRQADLQVHGGYDKAVYAYSHKHYSFWSEQFNKTYEDFGLVGENLTIDNFDEKDINITAIENTEYLLIEGYLVTSENTLAASIYALNYASKMDTKTVITLSDPNIVSFFSCLPIS